jgi:DNA-binding NtrC family response regulator
MAGLSKALVACCDCSTRQVLIGLVDRCGLKPVIATTTSDAISMLGNETVCVAFCQDDLPGDGFKAVLKAAKRVAVPVVVSSRLADPQRYLESMELGAFDFICRPYYKRDVAALASALWHKVPPHGAKLSASNVRQAT